MDTDPAHVTTQFCGSPFWDSNLTWNSSWPQFTDCFQKTALIGGPCALLWLVSSFYVWQLLQAGNSPLPSTRLSSLKMIASTSLVLLTLFELTLRVLDHGSFTDIAQLPVTAEVFSPAVLFLTVVLSRVLAGLEQQKGVRSSMVLCIFWLGLALGQLVPFYTIIIMQEYSAQPVDTMLFFVKFAVIIAHLVLFSLAEKSATSLPPGARLPCPDPEESLWSRLTFAWMKGLLEKGSKGDLTENDIHGMLPMEHSCNVVSAFAPAWNCEVEKAKVRNHTGDADAVEEDPEKLLDRLLNEEKEKKKKHRLHKRTKSMECFKDRIPFQRCQSETQQTKVSDSLLMTATELQEKAEKKEQKEKDKEDMESKIKSRPKAKPSFLIALIKSFGVQFLLRQMLQAIGLVLDMTDPVVFGLLLNFMEDKSAPTWRGYLICFMMVASKTLRVILTVRTNFFGHAFAIRIKSAIVNTVYKKALTMDTESRQESTVGQAVNLISVDAGDICHAFTWMVSEMIFVPIRIVVSLFMLYHLLGPSMFISVAMLVVMLPINSIVARKLSTMHRSTMDLKDERLKMLTEVINGVKILKMYAWEPSFIKKVDDARNKELDVMWWRSFWDAAMHFYWAVAPVIVSVTVFVAYVYSMEDHYLAPSIAFVAMSLIDNLRGSMGTVPHLISHFIKMVVSFRRLNEFLGRTDLDDDVKSDAEEAISIKNGFFSWKSGATPTLKNINMTVKQGSLVAVVGTVGCGKSSLISACLGEMKKLKGHISVKGSVAYVPQQAWIQHATLRDNVLFENEMNEELYNKCLDECALRTDLETLPGGDLTEIGEKGINLSGGQKQRVSLARAVYSQADLYLFDDPLSAVDCHVGSHIFNKVIGHQGMLAGKTRVLVTHGVQWLPMVDQIIVIRHGRVSEMGSYDELLTHNGAFAKFLKHYLAHEPEVVKNPEFERMKLGLLQRLESIPKEVKSRSSMEQDGSVGSATGSSTESSSSDNESIIQELLRSASVELCAEEQADSDKSVNTEEEKEKLQNTENNNNKEKPVKEPSATLVEDEDYKVQEVQWSMMKDFAEALGYGWVVGMLALFVAQQTAERSLDLSLSQWTDDPQLNNLTALPPDSSDRLYLNNYYLTVYAGFGLIHAITTMAFKIIKLLRTVFTARMLHHKMLSRVLQAPMTFFDTTPVGRIVNRFSSDLNTMDSHLPNTMEWALYLVFSVVGRLIIVCYTTPLFTLLVLPMAAIFHYVQKFFVSTMRNLERLQSKVRSPIFSFFSETLNGTAVVRAYGAQERFIKEFQRRFDLCMSVELDWGNCNRWVNVRMESMGSLVVFGVIMSAIAYRDTMSAGMVGLAITQALDITGTLHGAVHMMSWLQTQLISVDRVKQYSTMKVEADWRKKETAPPASWPEKGAVKAIDLALRYREGLDLVLKGINVDIKAGEKVGIVGRTGAGKSSLTLALFRLVEPARGDFWIDDVSTSSLGLHDLRSRLTILPQDPVIFAGSLRMNLDPFAHYTDAEVWEALKHAHLSDFVSQLKEGLDHECGEGGENLSVGQRQLLCLARTLLHKTRVLVLDEATAAVDMETDDLIQRTIRSEFKECTVLTIAHRLNTIIDYDKILVLDKGQVVEFDSPNNLMDNPDSIFHDMVKKAGLLNKKS